MPGTGPRDLFAISIREEKNQKKRNFFFFLKKKKGGGVISHKHLASSFITELTFHNKRGLGGRQQ